MFGRNDARPRLTRAAKVEAGPRGAQDASVAIECGTGAKMREREAHAGPRPVHPVEDVRQSAQK